MLRKTLIKDHGNCSAICGSNTKRLRCCHRLMNPVANLDAISIGVCLNLALHIRENRVKTHGREVKASARTVQYNAWFAVD